MRSEKVDIFRGIGILLVILGHLNFLGLSDYLHKIIYSFHMAVFFILSGVLFNIDKKVSLLEFIYGKFKRLIIPAWVIGFICGVPFFILLLAGFPGIDYHVFLLKLLGTLTGYSKVTGNFHCSPLWFLFCLFVIECIAGSARFIFGKNCLFVLFIIGVISIFKFSNVNLDSMWIPFNIPVAFSCLLFFSIGISIRHLGFVFLQKKWFNFNNNSAFLSLIFSILALLITNEYMTQVISVSDNFFGSDFYQISLCIIVSILGALFVFSIASLIQSVSFFSSVFSWLGNNTIVFLGFDYYANSILSFVFSFFNITDYVIVVFLVKLFLLSFLVFVISKFSLFNNLIKGKIKICNK